MSSDERQHHPDTSPAFFERLYQSSEDPWNFRHSTYERERYAAICHSLADREYRSAFEPGCAIGELTAMLAPLCHSLEAIDFSASAVETARHRCQDYRHVDIHKGALPEDIPAGPLDLIVFSEIGYYFTPEALESLIIQLWSILEPGGRLVACHWLGHSDDHQLHGSKVHNILGRVLGAPEGPKTVNDGYTLQRWSK
ncbi:MULTISPECIES: SAM-dependent methyltransferase [Marinobacter]|uniref:SAM-dependent methyltransferase n=1 Tax=Marinobacter TaxID=2742 RepID=UPI001243F8D0|nr:MULTISPECIES: SAM-dependent methyltransferase [Marinobacter]MBL3556990.1 methyltransferase domain-containing protein [Marinobacter sp. JB05H06]